MTRRNLRSALIMVLGCIALGTVFTSLAQEAEQPSSVPDDDSLVVGFVVSIDNYEVSLRTNSGGFGVQRLANIFIDYGAEVRDIDLIDPVPSDVDVIVIISPTVSLSAPQLAHLYDAMTKGANLFGAFDPITFDIRRTSRITTRNTVVGLSELLDQDFAMRFNFGLYTQNWFTPGSLSNINDTWARVYADNVLVAPIVEPLARYQLPVYTWAASTLETDIISTSGNSVPLLTTNDGFSETNIRNDVERNDNLDTPIPFNLEQDIQGTQLLAGIGYNAEHDSRILLLADGQIAQNLFGLANRSSNTALPRYPGNALLISRSVGWILELPESEWRILDEGFSQIALDGRLLEWDTTIATATDPANDVSPVNHDIQRIQAAQNDQFTYIALQTTAPLIEDIQIVLRAISQGTTKTFIMQEGETIVIDETGQSNFVLDAAYIGTNHVEIRLPNREIGRSPTLTEICLRSVSVANADCFEGSLLATTLRTVEPVPVRFPEGPMAQVRAQQNVNLRTGPGTNFGVAALVEPRQLFSVIGRNSAGTWVQVRDGANEAWIAEFLVGLNTSLELLPITAD